MKAFNTTLLGSLALGLTLGFAPAAQAFEADRPECIAPAKPGGGFDLTCRVVSTSLDKSGILKKPMMVTFMPGGIGAVAYAHMNSNRRNDPNAIVAASAGSALNLAQGKFGRNLDEHNVRWLAAAGTDYGAIIVKQDAPWKTLHDLIRDYKQDPGKYIIGAGGTIGSQDWMKAALLARAAGVDPRKMRYVAFEGGGEATASLIGNHIQIYPGDIAELKGHLDAGTMRVLAVMAPERLPGELSGIPTAKELGYDMEWSIFRGYYMGPDVPDEAYQWWVTRFKELHASPEFDKVISDQGLFELKLAGADFEQYVKTKVAEFRTLSREMGLLK